MAQPLLVDIDYKDNKLYFSEQFLEKRKEIEFKTFSLNNLVYHLIEFLNECGFSLKNGSLNDSETICRKNFSLEIDMIDDTILLGNKKFSKTWDCTLNDLSFDYFENIFYTILSRDATIVPVTLIN